MIHGEKDLITGRFWNSETEKWVVKLRTTTKGKTKGSTYDKQLDLIKQTNTNYKSYGWLPICITMDKLKEEAFLKWNYNHDFDIDKAVAVFTLIIVKRCKMISENKTDYFFKAGFVGISSNNLRKWVDAHKYLDYLNFLEDLGYIRAFRSTEKNDKRNQGKSYIPGKNAILYKIADYLMFKQNDDRKFHRVDYSSSKSLVKIFNAKQEHKLSILKQQVRTELIENVYTIAEQFDTTAFASFALANPDVFKNGLEEVNDLIVRTERIKELDFNINPSDDFSGRFHSPFTNIKKCVRNFIRIDNEPATELDIKNSQFFLFSLLRSNAANIKPILRGMTQCKSGVDKFTLPQTLDLILYFYGAYKDVRNFLDNSANGSIYQVMMQQYGREKKYVKDLCFKALFSNDKQSKREKKQLEKHYPNVVRLCESINTNGKFTLPKILQTLESRIYLDMIALEAVQQGVSAFITVHDAYLIKACDVALFEYLIEDVFNRLGLPKPQVSVEVSNNCKKIKN